MLALLDRDVLFEVRGSMYRMMRIRDNGEINAWGPIHNNMKSPYGSMRTFRWTDIDPNKVYGLWQRPP